MRVKGGSGYDGEKGYRESEQGIVRGGRGKYGGVGGRRGGEGKRGEVIRGEKVYLIYR